MRQMPSAEPARGASVGPPWRTLLLLAALVLLGHTLVLGTSLQHLGLAPTPAPVAAPVMITRSIAQAPPAPVPPAPARTAARPAPPDQAAAAPQAPALSEDAPEDSVPDAAVNDLEIAPPQASAEEAAQASATPEAPAPASAASQAKAATPPAGASATPAPDSPAPTPVTAMALPASAQLTYQSTASYKGLSYHAKSELLWRNGGATYDVRMTVSALFRSRSMASQGQVGAQGLAPGRFSDQSRSEVAAHFEPDKGQISFSANTPAVPWVAGTQDRASIFIQLGGMLAGNPAAFPAGTRVSVYTVGPRDAGTWTFQVEGQEMLRLPFGELATLKLSRQLRHEHDQKLEVWYAPTLGYLPVRNKLSESNGDFVDQQLSAVGRP